MVELESSTSKVAQLQIGKSKYLINCEKCVEHGSWSSSETSETNHIIFSWTNKWKVRLKVLQDLLCWLLLINVLEDERTFFRHLKSQERKM